MVSLASKKSGRVGTIAAVQGSDQSADLERRSDTQDQSAPIPGQIRASHKSLRLDVSHRELIKAWMSLFSGANAAVGARLLGPRLPRITQVRAERSWRGSLPHFASPALDSQSAQGARGKLQLRTGGHRRGLSAYSGAQGALGSWNRLQRAGMLPEPDLEGSRNP